MMHPQILKKLILIIWTQRFWKTLTPVITDYNYFLVVIVTRSNRRINLLGCPSG